MHQIRLLIRAMIERVLTYTLPSSMCRILFILNSAKAPRMVVVEMMRPIVMLNADVRTTIIPIKALAAKRPIVV